MAKERLNQHTATRGRARSERIAERRQLFLKAMAEGATVGKAAEAAGVARRTPYRWREISRKFGEAWDEHEQRGTDVLEDEAKRRAVDGVKRPVYQQGKLVGYEQQYSDRLLETLLKARRPERFGDRLTVNTPPARNMSTLDAVRRLVFLLRKATDEETEEALPEPIRALLPAPPRTPVYREVDRRPRREIEINPAPVFRGSREEQGR